MSNTVDMTLVHENMEIKDNFIKLMKPQIETYNAEKVRLCCNVLEGEQKQTLYYETDKAFEQYLCYERADSFVLAIFPYAIRAGLDIVCEAPVTEALLHNLNVFLVPLLVKYDCRLKRAIKVIAETDSTSFEGKEVGTGVSLGVDSFYTIKTKLNIEPEAFSLSHLLYTSSKPLKHESEDRKKNAQKVANLLGLPMVLITTNSRELFEIGHGRGHVFTNLSAVFALQKLFRTYYYSTAYELTEFTVKNNSTIAGDKYLLLVLQTLNVPGLTFYMSGSGMSRHGKIEEIANWDIAQKNLRVCLRRPYNCGTSKKCRRTILEMDMIGKLENFRDSFDIDYYNENKLWYLKESFIPVIKNWGDAPFMLEVHEHFWKVEPELMKEAEKMALKEISQEKTKKENRRQRELMRFDMEGKLSELNQLEVEHYLANKPLYFKRLILKPDHDLMKPMHDYFWEKEPQNMEQAKKLLKKEQLKKENTRRKKLMRYDMEDRLDELDSLEVQSYLANKATYFEMLIKNPEHKNLKSMHNYFWEKEPELMKQAQNNLKKDITPMQAIKKTVKKILPESIYRKLSRKK